MHVITDSQGRAYELDLNIQSYRRVREDTAIDLGLLKGNGPGGQPLMFEIRESVLTLFSVIWAIVRPKAQKNKISYDDFCLGFSGEPYIAARDAFFEEWALFCRTLGRSGDAGIVEAFVESLETEAATTLQKHGRNPSGEVSTTKSSSSPASSESQTPAG